MTITKRLACEISEILDRDGYIFQYPGEVHQQPEEDVPELLELLAANGIHAPLSLEVFMRVVGRVNFNGSHPQWDRATSNGALVLPDPFVFDVNVQDIVSQFEEWKESVNIDGIQEVGDFCIEFSPDDAHKSDISGGSGYAVSASGASLDGVVLHERHSFCFVPYLRHVIYWGFFPGFEYVDVIPHSAEELIRRCGAALSR